MRRHWSINGRFLTQPATGVQRYAAEIVRALDALLAQGHPLATDLSIDLVTPPGCRRRLPLMAIRTVACGTVGGHLWEQAVLPTQVSGGLLSLGNSGPLSVRRQIVCIHDVNTRAFPQSYSLAFRALQRVMLPLLGQTAAQVTSVSQHSAAEIARHGICAAAQIAVMPNGHDHVAQWTPRHSETTRRVAGPDTIVMVGTPAPHKNMDLILGLAERLAVLGLQVAVVGMAEARLYQAGRSGTGRDHVTWLGKISDAELAALLRSSLCLAFPSFVEGFGLPPLEAMALGCPVVSSDRASMPEICGDAALYASPTDPEAWLNCFARLRHDEDLRRLMIARGRAQAMRFSWGASAERYLEAMSTIDALGVTRSSAPTRRWIPTPSWVAGDAGRRSRRLHEPAADA
ncbi:glycosyltransferase family 1 protein [Lichenihabitans sp. Uapishka_5]|uniref:glycosyltransferase family 4 protein n=1 Tax=Lichenihabitans sp. Uapishka_5 TaxID=3037302 RepID=UPI0029E7E4C5|nr:glycosyltransferase family 1 protein [Lichenihabitans sp. Uapishka_5]MDX7950247.1 glycosyltransferase family 1 protein [Lichenihabitans sp. Uapishka_5]